MTDTPTEPWTLSAEDSRQFVETILDPPEPNDALKAAAERYKARRKSAGV
jgi:uncharacterized protein (DUF1778 family)